MWWMRTASCCALSQRSGGRFTRAFRTWRGHTELNGRSIGIEIVNPGHEWGYRDFPVLQLAAVCDLCLSILSRHAIPARNIVAHSDVAPDRKEDPGEKFDWEGLARNSVGVWPAGVPDLGTTGVVRDAAGLRGVRAALADVGYRVASEGGLDPALSAVLRAFQRHWRPEAVTGQADSGTHARLLAVAQMVTGRWAAGAPAPTSALSLDDVTNHDDPAALVCALSALS